MNLGVGTAQSEDPLGRTYVRTATDLAPLNIFLEYASVYQGIHFAQDKTIINGSKNLLAFINYLPSVFLIQEEVNKEQRLGQNFCL